MSQKSLLSENIPKESENIERVEILTFLRTFLELIVKKSKILPWATWLSSDSKDLSRSS